MDIHNTALEDILEKARKDISKLQKKVIVDKRGRKKTVYVKRHKVPTTHKHPTHLHAEAVAAYNSKKQYASKKNALAYVESHYGKEYADYILADTDNNGKRIPQSNRKKKSTVGSHVTVTLPDGKKLKGQIVRKELHELTPVQSDKDVFNEKSKGFAKDLTHPDQMPPIVVDSNGYIIDGHHRWGAAQYAGLTHINVIVDPKASSQLKDDATDGERYGIGAGKFFDSLEKKIPKANTKVDAWFINDLIAQIDEMKKRHTEEVPAIIDKYGNPDTLKRMQIGLEKDFDIINSKIVAYDMLQKLNEKEYEHRSDYIAKRLSIWSNVPKEDRRKKTYMPMSEFAMIMQAKNVNITKIDAQLDKDFIDKRFSNHSKDMKKKVTEQWQKGNLFLSSIIDDEFHDGEVYTDIYLEKGNGRAHYNHQSVQLYSRDLTQETVVHELVHMVEDKLPKNYISSFSQSFLINNSDDYLRSIGKGDETNTWSDARFGEYNKEQVYKMKKGVLCHPYCGRKYGSRSANEVVSQFMSVFLKKPYETMKKYPEHFSHVINTLQG
jgi:hypothetical protein